METTVTFTSFYRGSYRGVAASIKTFLGLGLGVQQSPGLALGGSSSLCHPLPRSPPQLAPVWEMLWPMRNLQYSCSSGTGMLSHRTAFQWGRFMGSITEAVWRDPRNGWRSDPGPASAGNVDWPHGSYPTVPRTARAMSSQGEQCQRLPFWLVVVNSSLSPQNDVENQFPNLRDLFFPLNGILASQPALA